MKYLILILLASSVACLFSDDFYQILAKENAKVNLITSPLSVEIVMSMMYMAAGGETAEELRNTLELPEDKKELANNYWKCFSNFKAREKSIVLRLANRIYINKNYSLIPEFNQLVQYSFKAKAKKIRLDDPNEAASIINNWVNNKTRGKIRYIVSPSDMSSDLSAIVVNAIYFQGQWKYQFRADQTHQADFYVSSEKNIPVEMMTMSERLFSAYLNDLGAKVIELPYRKSNLSMRIFLPNTIDGLSILEEKIVGFSRDLQKNYVDVKLPKFKIEFSAKLKAVLQQLGIREAFESSADFSGLALESSVEIDNVVQKAFLKVDENGTEASAATKVLVRRKKSVSFRHPMEFIADHPFAYTIHDKDKIYFQGHIVKPEW
ncbi:serine protease inhibitor 42Dd [Drosophila subpulchrella]|uniref:serine protease inhibitor 42Dd n=1 Tax=Drosophila subpulchrella TaxID=1486046 RepID=UPI0018A1518A|nr:serine protease inhibitor 42Dd [Drosophila subpulchrella]